MRKMKKKITKLLALALLSSCGISKKESRSFEDYLGDIIQKRDVYLDAIPYHQDQYGFLYSDKCDSVLFTGLADASGVPIDLLQARDSSGAWHRRAEQNCYPNGSGSTISRDMFAGILWSLYTDGDIESLHSIVEYGRSNNWIMGKGSIDRTYFTPAFQDTLYRLAGKTYKGLPYLWVDPVKDHQRHVVALNIILRGEAQGKIDKPMLDLLNSFKESDPRNALFQYGSARFSNGDQTEAVRLLMDEEAFPSSGPIGMTCSRWYWEQHQNERFGCREDQKEYNVGGDFIFIAMLLEGARKVSHVKKEF